MFKLRREMQAVSEYLSEGDMVRAKKWSDRLLTHYRKIAEMVPEWQEELSLDWAERLEQAINEGEKETAGKALERLGGSCRSCHRDYRAVAAALYRAPDFSGIRVQGIEGGPERAYPEVMERLSQLVNRVKIAYEDGRPALAIDSVVRLEDELHQLGGSCSGCHQDEAPRERILGGETAKVLGLLKAAIEAGETKVVGHQLGTAAVITCARCHGVHRTLSDLKQVLSD